MVPFLFASAATGLGCVVLLLAFRVRVAPLLARSWWQTRYHLVIGLTCLLLGIGNLYAYFALVTDRPYFLPPEFRSIRGVGACLFLTTGLFPLAAWIARRRGSSLAGTLTAAANIVLAVFFPLGLIPLGWWIFVVRPEEERNPAAQ